MGAFQGFPADATAFFAELEVNNNRTWWQANKPRFDTAVRAPMEALVSELAEEHGTFHLFRMHRDTRFSKDKTPYKLAQGAVTEREGGSTLYVQLSRAGLFVGGGVYHPQRDQLERYRQAVADDHSGAALLEAIAAARRSRLEVTSGDDPLTTAPRGYPKDHPRTELLRWKGCIAHRELGTPRKLHTRAAATLVTTVWAQAAPVLDWLDANVGPSELPPP